MFDTQRILLASHGTQGAMAAVQACLDLCRPGSELHHLQVVPEFWKGMTGDDWLNNGVTRDRFRRYLETEIGREAEQHFSAVEQLCRNKGVTHYRELTLGNPEQCLLEFSKAHDFDLVVIGSPRPKGVPGLRSRMKLEPLSRSLSTPLLIVPYPDE